MKKLKIQNMQSSISAQLTQAILDGDIEDGSELTQVDLAEQLGVSRMPVREALFTVEQMGLVARLPNNHCRVVRPTRRQLMRTLSLAALLEADVLRGLALETAAKLPTDEDGFHLALREACGEGYPRRVLAIVCDVYVGYLADAAREKARERENTLDTLRGYMRSGEVDAAVAALDHYFDLLSRTCPFEDEES